MVHLKLSCVIFKSRHGIIHQRSCLSNLLTAEEWVSNRLEQKNTVDIGFLDLATVFQSVNHNNICAKMSTIIIQIITVQRIKTIFQICHNVSSLVMSFHRITMHTLIFHNGPSMDYVTFSFTSIILLFACRHFCHDQSRCEANRINVHIQNP